MYFEFKIRYLNLVLFRLQDAESQHVQESALEIFLKPMRQDRLTYIFQNKKGGMNFLLNITSNAHTVGISLQTLVQTFP